MDGVAWQPKRKGRPLKDPTKGPGAAALRMRRYRERKALIAAGQLVPEPVRVLQQPRTRKKMGRPLLPYEMLTKSGRDSRVYRAKRAAGLLLLADAAAFALEAQEAVVECEAAECEAVECEAAEREAAEREAQERRLAARQERVQRSLGSRGSDGSSGYFQHVAPVPADCVEPRTVDPIAMSEDEFHGGGCYVCKDDLQIPCPASECADGAWGYSTCCAHYAHYECVHAWIQSTGTEISPYAGHLASRGHMTLVAGCPLQGQCTGQYHPVTNPRGVRWGCARVVLRKGMRACDKLVSDDEEEE